MLSVIMLILFFCHAECRYVECRYTEWRYAECHLAEGYVDFYSLDWSHK
jgi:hypothetical protein